MLLGMSLMAGWSSLGTCPGAMGSLCRKWTSPGGQEQVETKEQSSSPLKGGKKSTLSITEEAANTIPEISVLCMSDQMHTRFVRGSNILSFREQADVSECG